MFEKTLSDLVRGIRAHKDDEPGYIAECILEIKKELRTDNMSNKANAVAKLTYLHMMGYDMSWAAFNIIEVMSSSKFVFKRIGYLAASQCFHEGIDVAMLATNLVKKDVLSIQTHESSIALSSLSCFLTQDLAMDLANDVMALMISTKPIIRKKSTLAMYCIFMKFPDALRPAFPRLKEKLEDEDPGVQCAAVNVITELARHNPQNYLSMAPIFYNLMTSSSNNWMLIKIIKLFGSLCPMEQRLGKKLLDPLTNLINTTSAMSLLYECVMTMIKAVPAHDSSMQLCVNKLRLFVEDSDQNLKYLGLLALGDIVKEHPRLIQPLRDMIITCLEDRDESIRRRALNLLGGMVSRKNLVEIVNRLRQHLGDSESTGYRDEIISKIISICSEAGYSNVTNFEWYLTVLTELLRVEGIKDTGPIARHILDVTIRVPDVRTFSVRQMALMLNNTEVLASEMSEALFCVAYICGEFASHLEDPGDTLMCFFKQPRLSAAPAYVQATIIQNSLKLYTRVLEVSPEGAAGEELRANSKTFLMENLESSLQSGDIEVQERASVILQVIRYMAKVEGKGGSVLRELKGLFEGELNPVAPIAQEKVPVPEGLDLNAWINPPPSDSEPEDMPWDSVLFGADKMSPAYMPQADSYQATEEELTDKKKQREVFLASNPHYIKAASSSIIPVDVEANSIGTSSGVNVLSKPINLSVPILMDTTRTEPVEKVEKVKKHEKKGKSSRKGKKKRNESSEEEIPSAHKVNVSLGEMPEGAVLSVAETRGAQGKSEANPHSKLNINLDAPLRDEELIPVRKHREAGAVAERPVEASESKAEERKRRKEKKHSKRDKGERDGDREDRKKEKSEERDERKSKRKHRKKGGEEPDLVDMGQGEDGSVISGTVVEPSPVREEPKPGNTQENSGDNKIGDDDLDFWLTTDANHAPAAPGTNGPAATPGLLPPENGTQATEDAHRKKHKKHKRDKDRKRDKTQTEPEKDEDKPVESPLLDTATLPEATNDILELGFLGPDKKPLEELAADANMQIQYEIKQNKMYNQQLILHLTINSRSPSAITAMEFNLVDSLSVQAVRPIGVGPRDAIVLPFQLMPTNSQETQIPFNISNVVVAQTLKGTLTYFVNNPEGSTSEKLDVRIPFPVSAFIHTSNFSKNDFMEVLASGELGDAVTSQFPFIRAVDFNNAVTLISNGLHVLIIERVGTGASLYGVTMGQHHVCLLVKDSLQSGISVSVKTSDQVLSQSVATEVSKLV